MILVSGIQNDCCCEVEPPARIMCLVLTTFFPPPLPCNFWSHLLVVMSNYKLVPPMQCSIESLCNPGLASIIFVNWVCCHHLKIPGISAYFGPTHVTQLWGNFDQPSFAKLKGPRQVHLVKCAVFEPSLKARMDIIRIDHPWASGWGNKVVASHTLGHPFKKAYLRLGWLDGNIFGCMR